MAQTHNVKDVGCVNLRYVLRQRACAHGIDCYSSTGGGFGSEALRCARESDAGFACNLSFLVVTGITDPSGRPFCRSDYRHRKSGQSTTGMHP
jgi:hypothetical protein